MIFLEICPFSLSFKIYCRKVYHCILIFKSGFNVFLPALPVLISMVTSLSSLSLPFKKTWSNVWVFYSLFKELLVLCWFSIFSLSSTSVIYYFLISLYLIVFFWDSSPPPSNFLNYFQFFFLLLWAVAFLLCLCDEVFSFLFSSHSI